MVVVYFELWFFFFLVYCFQSCRSVLDILGKEKLHSPVSGHLRAGHLKYTGSANIRSSWRVPSGANFAQPAAFNYFVYTVGHGSLASDGKKSTAL